MKKFVFIIKVILGIIFGIVFGYIFYYNVLMEIIDSFAAWETPIYMLISITALIASVCAFIMLFFLISGTKISRKAFKYISAAYFLLLIMVFFARHTLEREFSFDLIGSLNDIVSDREMLVQTILNLIVLVPLGYYFKKLKFIKAFVFFAGTAILIELLQYVFARGVFDLFDIICYLIGMTVGYFIFQKIEITRDST